MDLLDPEMNMASDDEDEDEDELESLAEGRRSQTNRKQSSVFEVPPPPTDEDLKPTE